MRSEVKINLFSTWKAVTYRLTCSAQQYLRFMNNLTTAKLKNSYARKIEKASEFLAFGSFLCTKQTPVFLVPDECKWTHADWFWQMRRRIRMPQQQFCAVEHKTTLKVIEFFFLLHYWQYNRNGGQHKYEANRIMTKNKHFHSSYLIYPTIYTTMIV